DRRAALLRFVDDVRVGGNGERYLARDHPVGEHRVAWMHREAIARDDPVEELARALLAQVLEQRAIPFSACRFGAELALPFRLQEIGPAPRQLLLGDDVRVVRLYEDVDELRRPAAVRGERAFQHALVQRRADLLQEALAIQRLDLEPGHAYGVEVPAARLLLRHQTLQHLDRRGAPQVDTHAVAFLEVRDQRLDGRRRVRGIDVDRAILARRLQQLRRGLRRTER